MNPSLRMSYDSHPFRVRCARLRLSGESIVLRIGQANQNSSSVLLTTSFLTVSGKLSEAEYERMAQLAGISVVKFKRKFDRGDVELDEEGNPLVRSKKELKKLRKAEAKAEESKGNLGEKRKRDEAEEKPKKKKKKHQEA